MINICTVSLLYAPRGQKVVAQISGKKFKRVNFAAGICMGKWVAPIEYNGTTNSALFELWFEKCLLREVKPGSVIVLDNATFHRKSVLPALAQRYGCSVLFLPPYSPDLNPIEKSGLGSNENYVNCCLPSTHLMRLYRTSFMLVDYSSCFILSPPSVIR